MTAREEIAEILRRLRSALELQAIFREEEFPRTAPRSSRARRRAASPAATARRAPQTPAARGSAPPAPSSPAPRIPPAAVATASWQSDPSSFSTMGELHDAFAGCQRCVLGGARTNFVFGVGNPNAKLLLIGEAPGREEDLQGEPFVGAAGQLLDKILAAVGFRREEVYIANILKCRPPGNRNPEPIEIASCSPILARQIELIRPMIICTLGSFAAKTILGAKEGISRLRGRIHYYRGIPVVPTFHPAALLRNPSWKKPTWEDVQLLRREYDRLLAESPSN
jgi:DNA polymerase